MACLLSKIKKISTERHSSRLRSLKCLKNLKNSFLGHPHTRQRIITSKSLLCQTEKAILPDTLNFKVPHYAAGDAVATRKAFGKALEYAGSLSEKIVSLDAEVNNSTYEDFFAQHYPQRFFQAFVAEQNMVGMAAGMASQGFIPFCSTFAAFFTRAYDQLRMSAISKLPLRLVGSHCGVSIGQDGPSQMGLEDLALFRTLPDSVILYPCDAVSTYRCVELMANHHTSMSYLRTTRARHRLCMITLLHLTLAAAMWLNNQHTTQSLLFQPASLFLRRLRHMKNYLQKIFLRQLLIVTVLNRYQFKILFRLPQRQVTKW